MTCGIYMIQNEVNHKIYVGQSLDVEHRWKVHKWSLNGNYHSSTHLQQAWDKYGENSFSFTLLLECEQSQLNTYEQYYILELMTYDRRVGYNSSYGGSAERLTEESKKKIGDANRGTNSTQYGKRLSPETCQKMSMSKTGGKNPKAVPIVQLTLEGDYVRTWECSMDVERELGFHHSNIIQCCRRNRHKHKGYKWCYLSDFNTP